MAAGAALVIGVVTDCIVFELACCRITARIAAAVGSATTIAIFSGFDNAVTTLLTGNRCHTFVATEAKCLDTVALEGGADIANRARTERGNALSS